MYQPGFAVYNTLGIMNELKVIATNIPLLPELAFSSGKSQAWASFQHSNTDAAE